MITDHAIAPPHQDGTTDKTETKAPPTIAIDWDICLALLEDSDLSDDQKEEFIKTVWSIVTAFVDFGFGIHPTQQACGQAGDDAAAAPIDVLALIQAIETEDEHDADSAKESAA